MAKMFDSGGEEDVTYTSDSFIFIFIYQLNVIITVKFLLKLSEKNNFNVFKVCSLGILWYNFLLRKSECW